MTVDTQTRLDEAAAHLDAAAHLADRDNTPRGHALAGLIRLTRAAITPDSLRPSGGFDNPEPTPNPGSAAGPIRAALTALDTVDPLDGPPDLLAWSAQVADLLALVDPDGTTRR